MKFVIRQVLTKFFQYYQIFYKSLFKRFDKIIHHRSLVSFPKKCNAQIVCISIKIIICEHFQRLNFDKIGNMTA